MHLQFFLCLCHFEYISLLKVESKMVDNPLMKPIFSQVAACEGQF